LVGVPFDAFDVTAALLGMRRNVPSALLRANEFRLSQLAPAVYLRPAVVLERIAQQHGISRVERLLGRYARAHRYEHVTLSDLTDAFDHELGAGFAARELLPSLEGVAGTSLRSSPARDARPRRPPPSLWSRLLAAAQYLLTWVGP
jgi:hypothetical protein